MRVELDLPDWVDTTHIRIFAGVELAAIKRVDNDYWQVKETRCNRCGACCFFKPGKGIYPSVNGHCIHLKKITDGWECGIPLSRSRLCGDDPPGHIRRGTCCITYKKIPCK